MTEEEVVNVRCEINDSGLENGDDQSKIKGSYCNGGSHAIEKEEEKVVLPVIENGSGKVDVDGSCKIVGGSEAMASDADSGVSDLNVVVESYGAPASEGLQVQLDLEHNLDDEARDKSEVTVSKAAEAECECESKQPNFTAEDCTDASAVSSGPAEKIGETEITDNAVSVDLVDGENAGREGESVNVEECADAQNTLGEQKAQIDSDENSESLSIIDLNQSQECENRVGVDADVSGDENRGGDHEFKSVVGADADIPGDENGSHVCEFRSVASTDVHNNLADTERSECAADVVGVSVDVVEEDAQKGSAEETAPIESESVTDVNPSPECDSRGGDKNFVGTVVQETNESVSVTDANPSIVGGDVPNNLAETELSECPEENEIPDNDVNKSKAGGDVPSGLAKTELSKRAGENEIPDDDVVVSATDVEQYADEDAQNSLAREKTQVESISPADVNISHESLSGNGDSEDSVIVVQGMSESLSVTDVNGSVVGVVSATDGEKFADEDAQNSLPGEKTQVESITPADVNISHECLSGSGDSEDSVVVVQGMSESLSVTDVNGSVVGIDVPSGLAEKELIESSEKNEIPTEGEPVSKPEQFEEDSVHELVPEGENLSAPICADMPEDGNVISNTNENATESKGEPSVDISGMNDNAVQSEGEPSVEDEDARPAQEGSNTDNLDGQNMGAEVGKRPFYYLIRLPRYDDENIKEQIRNALRQVEEKTKARDAMRAEIQILKASCKECGQDVRAATSAERAARDLLKSKRQEMDSVQSTMNRLNAAITVEDIDDRIRNMEHMIQHETLPLKEEKLLLRQIKQLKQNREELSSNMGKQDQQSLDHKENVEEQFKHLQVLRKELESLRNNVLKTEAVTKAAKKKYDDEHNKLSELLARFKAADDIRQEAYADLQGLRKQLYEKNQYFWDYKNAANKGHELAAEGKREELQSLCVNQVERIMELWNKNDEFRRDYVRCNTRSTVRRLRTLDGRSLGPDEEPPVIPNALTERAPKNTSVSSLSTVEQEKKSIPPETVNIKEEPAAKIVEARSQNPNAKKPAKPVPLEKSLVVVSSWDEDEVKAEAADERQEPVRTKEEEERILEAERVRKEEEEAMLKERRRIEEMEKAEAARNRKKRNEDKARERAELRTLKEKERKDKEKQKRARKKERRIGAVTDPADNTEQETAPSSENLTESTEECNQTEKPVEVTKRPQRPSQFMRHTKAKSLPPPLRNRAKKRIQPWMWALITVVVVFALFYMGNNSALRSGLQSFGF